MDSSDLNFCAKSQNGPLKWARLEWVDDNGGANVEAIEAATEDYEYATSSDTGWERFLEEVTGDWFEYHTETGEIRWVEDSGDDLGVRVYDEMSELIL